MSLIWMIADSKEEIENNTYSCGPFETVPDDVSSEEFLVCKTQAGQTLLIRQNSLNIPIPASHTKPTEGPFKIILTDNYAWTGVADILVCENIDYEDALDLCSYLQDIYLDSDRWPRVVPQTRRLSRGMADIVGIPDEEN